MHFVEDIPRRKVKILILMNRLNYGDIILVDCTPKVRHG